MSVVVPSGRQRKLVYVKPYMWECTTAKDYRGTFEVRAWGVTPSSEDVLVRFLYQAPLIVELDPSYEWTRSGALSVYEKLCELARVHRRPVSWELLEDVRPLYSAYLRGGKAIRMRFDSWQSFSTMRWFLDANRKDKRTGVLVNANGVQIWQGHPPLKLLIRNEKVTPDIAMMIERGMETTGWLQFDASVVRSGRVSRVDLEYVVLPESVTPTAEDVCRGWNPRLKVLSIDAEANSEHNTAMPKHSNSADAAFCIGCVLRHKDGREEMHAFCSVKRPNVPNGVEMHFHEREEDAIKAYALFIRDSSPNIINGHNSMGWDEEYLWLRLTRNMEMWPNDSKLLSHVPTLRKKEWESSAYTGMRFYWVDRPGVLHCDLLPWSKRSLNKLDSYKLGYLDKKYGGAGKLLGDEDRAKVDLDDVAPEKEPEEDYLEAHRIFEYYARGDPEELKRIVVYCVGCRDERGEMVRGDCGITLRLVDKLQMWMSLTQMAKVAFVQPFDVFTKGMQARTYNQVAREAHRRGMYITSKEAPPRIPVKGAHVFPPMRDVWELVYTFDFKGLYPSIIRRYNLCWTTYVPQRGDPNYDEGYDDPASPKYVADERCHIFDWTEQWHTDEYEEWKQGKKRSSKKKYTGEVFDIHHRYRVLKEPRGILPANLDKLAADRDAAKAEMKKYDKESFEYGMKDKEQDAIKLVMNSAYGGLGSEKGPLPNHPLAAIVTYMARCSAQKMAKYYEDTYGASVVYGDTDSAFVWYPERYHEEIKQDPHAWGKRMAKEGTALFEKPMELDFEKVFAWLFLANKKQYVGPIIPGKDPKTGVAPPVNWNLDKMISRGLMFVKRGAAPVMQEMQKELVMMALVERARGTPLATRQQMAMEAIERFSYRLMSHGVPEKELTITQKIGQNYKKEGNHLNVYRKHLVEQGKVVNPGDRMPYVLIKKEGAKGQGAKMELPEFRKLSHAPIDYLYYLEKRGVKPYDVVLEHGFKLVGFMKWHVRYLKLREKMLAELRKAFELQVEMRGERDTRRMDVVARRKARSAEQRERMSGWAEKWYRCVLRKKGVFGRTN
jgi:DNA polymerase elongation subunit (family B)